MNNDTIPTTPKKKRSLVLPIAAIIIAIAVAGFIASRAGLDKALVKQQVDNFIVQFKAKGKAQGRDIELTYGELEVTGSFARKHVLIHDIVLSVKPSERKPLVPGAAKKIDSLIITTPIVAIYPKSPDLSALRIEAPEAIDFAGEDEPTKSLLKITSVTPIAVDVVKKTLNAVDYTDVAYISPEKMDFTYLREQQAKGAEEATPSVVPVYDTLSVVTKPGSGFKSSMADNGTGLGTVMIDFADIVITPQSAPEGALKVAAYKGSWSNVLNEKNLNVITASLQFGPVTSADATAPYLPVSFVIDGTYEGAILKSPESVASAQALQSVIKLKTLTLSTKDASINATADFTASATDVLPVGTANITLTNTQYVLAELRKAGLLTPANDGLVNAVLQKATGIPVEQQKDTVIAIERVRGGAFKIGQTTFEELFALMLQQAMQGKSGQAPAVIVQPSTPGAASAAPLVPQLPPADKPKAAPIAVPDNGVRG